MLKKPHPRQGITAHIADNFSRQITIVVDDEENQEVQNFIDALWEFGWLAESGDSQKHFYFYVKDKFNLLDIVNYINSFNVKN